MSRLALIFSLTLALMFFFSPRLRADPPFHAQVLVFIPAYEGSKLYDTDLAQRAMIHRASGEAPTPSEMRTSILHCACPTRWKRGRCSTQAPSTSTTGSSRA